MRIQETFKFWNLVRLIQEVLRYNAAADSLAPCVPKSSTAMPLLVFNHSHHLVVEEWDKIQTISTISQNNSEHYLIGTRGRTGASFKCFIIGSSKACRFYDNKWEVSWWWRYVKPDQFCTCGFRVQYYGHCIKALHHNDVTWASRCIKSSATRLFPQQFILANIKEIVKTPHFCGSFISVGFPHKDPVMWKACLCHEIVIICACTRSYHCTKNRGRSWLVIIMCNRMWYRKYHLSLLKI